MKDLDQATRIPCSVSRELVEAVAYQDTHKYIKPLWRDQPVQSVVLSRV